jgi:quercetin dioxygenase-like cupin family protein
MPVIRNIERTPQKTVEMAGVKGVKMAVMVGREDGAPNFALRHFTVRAHGARPAPQPRLRARGVRRRRRRDRLPGGAGAPIAPGDVVYVPADQEHQFRAGDKGMRFLCLVPVTRNCGDATPGS